MLLSLGEDAKLWTSTQLSSVLLFPVKTVTAFFQFLTVSNARITELEVRVSKLQLENTQLKEKLFHDGGDQATTEYRILRAHIIGRDPSNINGYLYVDRGTSDSIYVNQPVVSIHGLVGKVKYVTPRYSIIETVENKGFAVSGIDVNTGIHGIVKKKTTMVFDFIRVNDSVQVGDSICTSGMSEIFPSGILIGIIKHIGQEDNLFFKPVTLTPSVQINRLDYVYLLFGVRLFIRKDQESLEFFHDNTVLQ